MSKSSILRDILTFAWRGSGKYVLFSCMVLSVIADIAGLFPIIGVIASLLLSGYFCAIFYHLIQSSASGGMEAPDFPDVSSIIADVVWPMLHIAIVAVVSFGPLLIYFFWGGDESYSSVVAGALVVFGIVYFPMAILAVVILGYTGASSPHIVLPSLLRGGKIYWVAVFMLIVLYFVQSTVAEILSGQTIVQHLVMAVVGSYTLITNARVLGIVYRERQDELGWI